MLDHEPVSKSRQPGCSRADSAADQEVGHDGGAPRASLGPVAQVLVLQRTIGNRAVAGLMRRNGAPASSIGTSRATAVQRVLEEFAGPGPNGQSSVAQAGQKQLYRETDDGKLYFKSLTSTETSWKMIEVSPNPDGSYKKTGAERVYDVPKRVPATKSDWEKVAYISGSTMLYPGTRYPHVTIDLISVPSQAKDVVRFDTLHYSRSNDDPYRSGYRRTDGGWACTSPNDRKDKQRECDDAVDGFFERVGLASRVIRK